MKTFASIILGLIAALSAHANGYECSINGQIEGKPVDIILNTETHGTNFSGIEFPVDNPKYLFEVEAAEDGMVFNMDRYLDFNTVTAFITVRGVIANGSVNLPEGGFLNYQCSQK